MTHVEGAPCRCGLPGWMPGVLHIPDRSHGGPMPRPIGIVNHIMQGYRTTMDTWARSPANDGRSVHFGIDRAGEVAQYVSIGAVAWHAGRRDDRAPTWPLYRAGTNPGEVTVGVEHEGFSVAPGYGYDYLYGAREPWPERMVAASVRVQRWVCEQAGIPVSERTIIGHYELNPVTRADDPGAQWPRERIIRETRGIVLSKALTFTQRYIMEAAARVAGFGAVRITPLPRTDDGRAAYRMEVNR